MVRVVVLFATAVSGGANRTLYNVLILCAGSFAAPWQSLLYSTEQYCLAWESKYLMELGNALDTILNGLVNMVAQEALKYTILSGTSA